MRDKYTISKIDNQQYCIKNGQFTRHLRQHNITAEEYYVQYEGMQRQFCVCGKMCSFKASIMEYINSCGSQKCTNLMISRAKQNFTDEQHQQRLERYQQTMQERYTEEDLRRFDKQKAITARERGSYEAAVSKRQETCLDRYGDAKYNNPTQITDTKLNWTDERKQKYLQLRDTALGGMTLTEYRDAFFKNEWKVKRKQTRVGRGLDISCAQMSEYRKYANKVRALTEQVYRKNKQIINPKSLLRVKAGRSGYQLDHIVSVKQGFLNNIPIEVISSVDNLQMLPWRDNIRKGWKHQHVPD